VIDAHAQPDDRGTHHHVFLPSSHTTICRACRRGMPRSAGLSGPDDRPIRHMRWPKIQDWCRSPSMGSDQDSNGRVLTLAPAGDVWMREEHLSNPKTGKPLMARDALLLRFPTAPLVLLSALASWICLLPPPAFSQNRVDLDDEAQKSEIIIEVARLLEAKYVLPDRGGAFAQALMARDSAGEYASYTDGTEFAAAVTADLVEITGDSHMYFRVVEPTDLTESTGSPLHHPIRLSLLGKDEHLGFSRLEWLPGRVGYLDLRRFYPISESKEIVDGAMDFLSSADAVIIDLRNNPGGAGESLPYLCSFFLPFPTQLTSYYSREDDFLKEFWTLEGVEGGPLSDVPLFLLTSPRTFSASEMLAYDMKVLGRATLIGERTGGGANSVDLYPVGSDFEIYISTSRAVNPVTGSNWEGVGVIPHVSVPADQALDTAVELAKAAAREHSSAREAAVEVSIGRMEALLARAESLFAAGEEPSGVAALDSLFLESGRAGFLSDFFMDLLSYAYFSGGHGQILLAILRKRAELFPSSEAHERLGYAYRMLGEVAEALRAFERALELDPANRNAAKMIERLRKERGYPKE
jgi:tetratricopeptide (TPR) repeat protein